MRDRERKRESWGKNREGRVGKLFFCFPFPRYGSVHGSLFLKPSGKTGHSVFLPVAVESVSDIHTHKEKNIKALTVLLCTLYIPSNELILLLEKTQSRHSIPLLGIDVCPVFHTEQSAGCQISMFGVKWTWYFCMFLSGVDVYLQVSAKNSRQFSADKSWTHYARIKACVYKHRCKKG